MDENISHVYNIQLGINLAEVLSPQNKEGIKYMLGVQSDADLPEAYLNFVWNKIKGHLEDDPVLSKMTVLDTRVLPYEEPDMDMPVGSESGSGESDDTVPEAQSEDLEQANSVEDDDKPMTLDEYKALEDSNDVDENDSDKEQIEESDINPDEKLLIDSINDKLEDIESRNEDNEVLTIKVNDVFKDTIDIHVVDKNIKEDNYVLAYDEELGEDIAAIEFMDVYGRTDTEKVKTK